MDKSWHQWLVKTASRSDQARVLTIAPSSRWFVWVLLAFVVTLLLWSFFLEIDDTVTGFGRVMPSSKVQEVQSLDGGILKSIYVTEGDFVLTGDKLLRVDETRFQSSFRVNESERESIQGTISRLESELALLVRQQNGSWHIEDISRFKLPEADLPQQEAARKLITERLSALKSQASVLHQQSIQKRQELQEQQAQVATITRSLSLAGEELAIKEPLTKDGVVTRVEVISLERQVNELQGELNSARIRIHRLQSALQEAESRRYELVARYRADLQKELQDNRERLRKLSEGQSGLEDRVQKTILYAPVDGLVKQMTVHTEGSVIQPGVTLVEIVPANDPMIVEARVQPADIAMLKPGQLAWIKLSAYEFSQYGAIEGTVDSISADTLDDDRGLPYYRVRIHLQKMNSHFTLLPGMTGVIDIVTGTRKVIDYLLTPLLKT